MRKEIASLYWFASPLQIIRERKDIIERERKQWEDIVQKLRTGYESSRTTWQKVFLQFTIH